jgi:hypothetical protein
MGLFWPVFISYTGFRSQGERNERRKKVRPATQPHERDSTMKKTDRTRAKTDWSSLDAMTEEEKHAAALSDPDAQPITKEKWERMKRVPRTKTIRRALGLSQEK